MSDQIPEGDIVHLTSDEVRKRAAEEGWSDEKLRWMLGEYVPEVTHPGAKMAIAESLAGNRS